MNCILVFETDTEKEEFKFFVAQNWENKQEYNKNIRVPYFEEIEGYNMDVIKEEFLNSQILKNMFNQFRNRRIHNSNGDYEEECE